MFRRSLFACLACVALLGQLSPQVRSGEEGQDRAAALEDDAMREMMERFGADRDRDRQRFKDFEKVTKDMVKVEGLFTLYRYDPSDKSKDPEKLLCQIPAGMLSEDTLFATSISSGGSFTGWMWTDYLIRWEIAGDNLKMITPDTNYVRKGDDPVNDVVKRTYNERYIATAPIVAMTKSGDPLIDLGKLLKSDIANVSFMARGTVRPDLSKWNKIKNFPENLLIETDLAIGDRSGGGSSLGVAYAFRKLPKLGAYSPRNADDRLGYFLTAQMDWSKKATERDTFDRLIQRWQLEKRDPSLALSPPKTPITFIIEKTVPVQWRRWVREGILDWNKAFEKIGYTGAVVVHQQTDDNEFADYDPEDARYNFFRWIVSGRAFAMGPSRVDPRTGQILDADIIMDDSFIRAWMQRYDIFAPSAMSHMKGPGFDLWAAQHPELAERILATRFPNADDPEEDIYRQAVEVLAENGRHVCTYASGFQEQMAFVHSAMIATASGKKLPEHFIGEAIREVVAHEVGHTIGLRHNFKASSWLSLDEIKRRRDTTGEPTTGSVMDYNPLLFFNGDTAENVRHFITPEIGPYDYWVIEYGYGAAKDGQNEAEFLKSVASRCAEPGLQYATDEDTMWVMSPDPLVNRYDMGDEPMTWIRSRFELSDELAKTINEWGAAEGESREFLRRAFNTLLSAKARDFSYLARLVGGQHFHRDHKGDPDARPAFVLVDSDTQRQALQLINDTLFTDDFLKADPELLNNLAPSRWSHWGSRSAPRLDYPAHDMIARYQFSTLLDIMAPPVLQRIYDAELKSEDPKKFTAAETITTVRDHIWQRLNASPNGTFTDAKPYLTSITRGLQRDYLDLMLSYAQTRPGDVMSADLHGMASFALRELSERVGRVLKDAALPDGQSKLDFASRAHLTESKSRIDRVLEAQFLSR